MCQQSLMSLYLMNAQMHFLQTGKFEQKKSRTELQKTGSSDCQWQSNEWQRWVQAGWPREGRATQMTEVQSHQYCALTFLFCVNTCHHNRPASPKEILSSCHAWWVRGQVCLFAWIEVKLEKASNRTPWKQDQVTALSSSIELHQEEKSKFKVRIKAPLQID